MDARLAEAATSRNLVIVVGTGVSAAISGSRTATWRGLLESGVERLEGVAEPALLRNIRENVGFGFDNDDLPTVLHAADRLKAELDKAGAAALAKWLDSDIGQLPKVNESLGVALRALPYPILTTNYDTLLATDDRRAATWRDPEALQGVMTGSSRDIGHLHGAWTDPTSIVLSQSDYDELLRADAFQTLQRSLHSLKSLVYVGYGAGLSDPNFSRLIKLHSEQFASGSVKHFRLCRSGELERLEREHAGDHIIPVAYGDDYDDLPGFISKLADGAQDAVVSEAGIVRDLAGDACVRFGEELVQQSIIAELREGDEHVAVKDVIFPPVMLPVPHADFIRAQREGSRGGEAPQRMDPRALARSSRTVVLVGEEGSGLSTAARWLALEAATHRGGAIPIAVSFRQVGAGPHPLRRIVNTLARSSGWIEHLDAPLPAHLLIVEDFSPYVNKISDRTIADFASSDAVMRVLSCALGAEDDTVEKLKAAGVEYVLIYLGKLGRKDIELYAKAASPLSYMPIVERVISTLTAENLARTPYTVGLLVSVLIRGTSLTANASQTTVLDDYVGALLGRGDPHEDARLGLDQSSREALLSAFAKHFVLENTGGVLESDAVQVFQDALTRLSWSESPIEVLQSLIDRKVLRRTGGKIVFARSTFLHLFAAKRAIQDSTFRDHLLENPLYYGPILSDYAALNRHDVDLVDRVNQLLLDDVWDGEPGGVFSELEVVDGPRELTTVQASADGPVVRPETQLDYFEVSEDIDTTPFPTTQHEQLPLVVRLVRVLELASVVLRDSDQIEDGEKKRAVLTNVLEHWGQLMNILEQDAEFQKFVQELGERMTQQVNMNSPDAVAKRDEALQELARIFPAALSLGGLSEHLASRRLLRPLAEVASSKTPDSRLESVVATAFMIYTVKEAGWATQLGALLENKPNIWVIRHFLLPLLMSDYVYRRVATTDEAELVDLCLNLATSSYRYETERHRVAHRDQIRTNLRQARLNTKHDVPDMDEAL